MLVVCDHINVNHESITFKRIQRTEQDDPKVVHYQAALRFVFTITNHIIDLCFLINVLKIAAEKACRSFKFSTDLSYLFKLAIVLKFIF